MQTTPPADPVWGQDWSVLDRQFSRCSEDKNHQDYWSFQMKHRHVRNKPFWTNCPECNATWTREAEIQEKLIRSGQTEEQVNLMMNLARASVPKRFLDADVFRMATPYPQMKHPISALRDYAKNIHDRVDRGICLAVAGDPGTGKTHAACGLVRACLRAGGTARYTTLSDMCQSIQETFNSNASTEKLIQTQFIEPDLLVIDEIGRMKETEFNVQKLWEVLDKRYRAVKASVVCTNLDPRGTKEVFTEAGIERLKERGGKLLRFAWPSMRDQDYRTED